LIEVQVAFADGSVPVSVEEYGEGHPVLLLHGGGGPVTVSGFAGLMTERHPVHVYLPIHPGFNGTARPDGLASIRQVAELYANLIEKLGLEDVTVIGNSIGGWIAAELAATGTSGVSATIIIDAVGLEVPGHPVVDFFSLSFAEIAQHSYYEPEKFAIDPAALSEEQQGAMAANRATLAVYGGKTMTDPELRGRLSQIAVPTLVLWGEADRIADPDYGRAFAEAISGSQFKLLEHTGHLPQIETPDALLPIVEEFVREHQADPSGG
jgi:pimeloyl-ACP methyl ester carboxylesterase